MMVMKNMNLSVKVLDHRIISEVSLFLTECEKLSFISSNIVI